MQRQHVSRVDPQRQDHGENLENHPVDELSNGLHVAGDTTNDPAAVVRVKKAEAEPLQFVVHLRPQRDDHHLTQPGRDDGGDVLAHSIEQRKDKHHGCHESDHLTRRPTRSGLPASRPMGSRSTRRQGSSEDIDSQACKTQAP